MDPGRMLTVDDVADLLSANEKTIRRWIKDGQLPAINLGHRMGYRIREADLDRFLLERQTNRDTMPPFDPDGNDGPRNLSETTEETKHRYLSGPENAGLPGYVVISGGTWEASEDGREWRRVEDPER